MAIIKIGNKIPLFGGKAINASEAQITEEAATFNENGLYNVPSGKRLNPININVPSTAPVINPLSVTDNGTYTAPSGVDGYSPVTVNVPQGITPTGNINITDLNMTDVANYATAQIVDADLVAENIKKDVNILGVVGSFEGGGEEAFYGDRGIVYKERMILPSTVTSFLTSNMYGNAVNMKYFRADGIVSTSSCPFCLATGTGAEAPPIEEIEMPNLEVVGYRLFMGLSKVKHFNLPKLRQMDAMFAMHGVMPDTVTLGSVGHAVESLNTNNIFTWKKSFTITVYVAATTIADIPAAIKNNAPWGASGATVVYRNSTTGEVIEA